MPRDVYLICLKRPDPDVLKAIRAEWPEDRYEVDETQILVVRSNGGKSIYDRIEDRCEGKHFTALIVRFRHYHGRHSSELWEWLGSQRR